MSTLHVSKFPSRNQAPVLVLLHGWGSSLKIWQACIDQLRIHFEVWCIDLPGHGESHDLQWDNSVEEGMLLLTNVMPPVCSLVGWSLGGLWAQLYMQYYPQRVRNMILLASTPKFVASEDWLNGMPEDTFSQFCYRFSQQPQKTLQQFFALQALQCESSKRIMQNLSQSSLTYGFDKIAWGLDWLQEIDLRGTLNPDQNSIYLLQGENDRVSSIAAAEDTVKIWHNLKLYRVANAGHVPFLSHPELFVQRALALK